MTPEELRTAVAELLATADRFVPINQYPESTDRFRGWVDGQPRDGNTHRASPTVHVPTGSSAYRDRVRAAITQGLQELAVKLDDFEQTSHGSFAAPGLPSVVEALLMCWHEPGPYWVSELAQRIDRISKETR